jgi:hypothetical protein
MGSRIIAHEEAGYTHKLAAKRQPQSAALPGHKMLPMKYGGKT